MKRLPWILVALLTLAVLFLWSRQNEPSTLSIPDTTDYVETIPFYKPIPRDSVVIRYKYATLPIKKDTCKTKGDACISDSAEVVIPIAHKLYEDSLYRVWVSGYDVNLDSIKVNSRFREIKTPVIVPGKLKRWGLGIQTGYGYPGGLYVGVGVSYNLWQW